MTLLHREDLENRQVKLTIQLEKEAWEKALEDAFTMRRGQLAVEGYAPGTAPREALEKAYGEDVLYQTAVDLTFPAALVEALQQQELHLAGTPTLNVVEIGPGGYTFEALVELYPEVELGRYKGLHAVREQVALSNDDVESALSDYCRANAVKKEVERAAMGDEVTLDFEGFVDGVAFEGGKGEDFPLVLGSGMFIPGFEEQVAGICPGEEREVHVTFPQAYTPELAGKAAIFRVKAKSISRTEIPALTEEFAAAQGFENLSALRRKVMEDVVAYKEGQARDAYEQALVSQVLQEMAVTIPQSMVDSQMTGLIDELDKMLQSTQGMTLAQYLEMAQMTMEDVRANVRAQAEEAARYELAMTEIALREDITVSDEDLQHKYGELSAMYGMPVDEIRRQLPPARLRHDLKIQLARNVIVESAI